MRQDCALVDFCRYNASKSAETLRWTNSQQGEYCRKIVSSLSGDHSPLIGVDLTEPFEIFAVTMTENSITSATHLAVLNCLEWFETTVYGRLSIAGIMPRRLVEEQQWAVPQHLSFWKVPAHIIGGTCISSHIHGEVQVWENILLCCWPGWAFRLSRRWGVFSASN